MKLPRFLSWIPVVTLVISAAQVQAQGADQIAFVSDRDGNKEIYVMNSDGSNQRRLTDNPANDDNPGWSPDGQQIVFNTDRDGNMEIYAMGADGSNQRRLTTNTVNDLVPDWSPDGQHIVFASDRDGNMEIYVMDADGNNQRRLTNNGAFDFSPRWSPDGSQIVFESNFDGDVEIYAMDPQGASARQLTVNGATDRFPAWSPDGAHIAYGSDQDGNMEVYVLDVNTLSTVRLTNSPGDDFWPTWSPDGNTIAFVTSREGNWEIYAMNADGSLQHSLTLNPAQDSAPAWQPSGTGAVIVTESCSVVSPGPSSTLMHVGPGSNRGSIGYLPAGQPFNVIGQATASDGSLWWKLDKNQAAPTSAANEVWVADTAVTTSGNCNEIGPVSAPPIVPFATHVPTAAPATATPQVTAIPVSISFVADKYAIHVGDCVTIRWDVEGILSVFYQGQGVVGHDSRKECPTTTTTYTLRVNLRDGTQQTRTITITVSP
jgi:Tol biopolymer transport system component